MLLSCQQLLPLGPQRGQRDTGGSEIRGTSLVARPAERGQDGKFRDGKAFVRPRGHRAEEFTAWK
jgi:hypothetical protein